MTENAQGCGSILEEDLAAERMRLLAELRDALHAAGVPCVLARNHRLVLRYSDGPYGPSGLTDPQLHIFTPDATDLATTDGAVYRLGSGDEIPAADPAAAAEAICRAAAVSSGGGAGASYSQGRCRLAREKGATGRGFRPGSARPSD